MIDRRNWQLAFLQQARADWEAYQKTHETYWPACHRLHFLQMATEKLGKALLLAGQAELARVTGSHAAFVKFMQVASYDRNLQIRLKMAKPQLKAHFFPSLMRSKFWRQLWHNTAPIPSIPGLIEQAKFAFRSFILFRRPNYCNHRTA